MKIIPIGLSVLLLGGCAVAPMGPSRMALPGNGKSYDDFARDDANCRQMASYQTPNPGETAVRDAAVGTAVGALAGAAIGGKRGSGVGAGLGLLAGSAAGAESSQAANYAAQRQYDDAYTQCMYASGHKVSVPGRVHARPVAPPPAQYVPPPPPQYAPPPQYGSPPQYAPQPQYDSPPQYAPQPQYDSTPQYGPAPQQYVPPPPPQYGY